MAEHIRQTIADLQKQLAANEQRVADTKRLINQLAEMAGMPHMYPDAELSAAPGVSLAIQSDQFYGQPLASSIREILELRRNLKQGPATVNEIYDTLLEGGYAFNTRNEENAKRMLRESISKNPIFHRLPNSKYGLRDWYPSVKSPKAKNGDSDASAETEVESAGEA